MLMAAVFCQTSSAEAPLSSAKAPFHGIFGESAVPSSSAKAPFLLNIRGCSDGRGLSVASGAHACARECRGARTLVHTSTLASLNLLRNPRVSRSFQRGGRRVMFASVFTCEWGLLVSEDPNLFLAYGCCRGLPRITRMLIGARSPTRSKGSTRTLPARGRGAVGPGCSAAGGREGSDPPAGSANGTLADRAPRGSRARSRTRRQK